MNFHNSAALKKNRVKRGTSTYQQKEKRSVELPRQTTVKLTVSDVHGDFETETHVASCRCLPFHGVSPKVTPLITANRVQRHSEHRYVLCPIAAVVAISRTWNLTSRFSVVATRVSPITTFVLTSPAGKRNSINAYV
jgi:hypothetical protein